MCGIAGIASLKKGTINRDLLGRMVKVLEHRGPDDEGFYLSSSQNPNTELDVGLGHRRLSIIDLKGGSQPMANENKTIWIVYNGEIYNFPELKSSLIKKGHRFTTKSDTEVLLHLYEEKGVECLGDLRGMFAFSIWDANRNELFLARDRAGQKPLYYYEQSGLFIFASEIKSILEHNAVKRECDLTSLDKYLTYGYVPSPDTMFKGIKKLPPAHYMIYKDGRTAIKRYWGLDYSQKSDISFAESKERLYNILGEATKMRLISDVPLGAFLSGGVDSSCVVALMSKLSSGKVKTFTIGFTESDYSELEHARYISKRFGTDHKEFIVSPKALEVLPKLAWHYGEPFGDSSCIPTYYVSNMTREHVTVALNGDGGDESFAGYERYRGIRAAQLLRSAPRIFLKAGLAAGRFTKYGRRFFNGIIDSKDLYGAYLNWMRFFTERDKEGLYSGNIKDALGNKNADDSFFDIIKGSGAQSPVEEAMYADVNTYLPEDLLVKVDIATMANSLEGRSPFLDHKLMEFAASLPVDYKLRGLNSKHILKETFKRDIPLSFLNRRKKGFGVPVGRWFSGELKDFTADMLLGRESLKRGIFSESFIKNTLREHNLKKYDHTHRIWALLSFEMWHRIFIDKHSI